MGNGKRNKKLGTSVTKWVVIRPFYFISPRFPTTCHNNFKNCSRSLYFKYKMGLACNKYSMYEGIFVSFDNIRAEVRKGCCKWKARTNAGIYEKQHSQQPSYHTCIPESIVEIATSAASLIVGKLHIAT